MNSNAARKMALESPEIIWFVARGSTMKGPFTTEQLQEQVRSREISYLDFCWRQGFREWRPIGSVEDFGEKVRLKSLPFYPSVEVPSSQSSSPSVEDNVVPSPNLAKPEVRKKVQISFARSRRHSISIYEWGLAGIFAVVLAYFSADFALNEVSSELIRRLELVRLGNADQWGEVAQGVDPTFWEPLYSAPGYSDVVPAQPNPWRPQVGALPVHVEGFAVVSQDGVTHVGGMQLRSPQPLPAWSAEEMGLDPIYIKPVAVEGYLVGKNPSLLDVSLPGNPALVEEPSTTGTLPVITASTPDPAPALTSAAPVESASPDTAPSRAPAGAIEGPQPEVIPAPPEM